MGGKREDDGVTDKMEALLKRRWNQGCAERGTESEKQQSNEWCPQACVSLIAITYKLLPLTYTEGVRHIYRTHSDSQVSGLYVLSHTLSHML